MPNDDSIFIAGIGARTAVGLTAASSAAAVRARIAAFAQHPTARDTVGEPVVVARLLPEELTGAQRFLELALPAAREALAVFHQLEDKRAEVHALIGLPGPRPGLPETLELSVAARFECESGDGYDIVHVETNASGHCAGLVALKEGWRRVRGGDAEFCLVGGVDSYMAPETLELLEKDDQLHGAGEYNNAWGFVPGEAAGFCLIASERAMARYRLEPLGTVAAVTTALEKNLIKTDSVCLGQGLSEAVRAVLVGLPPQAKIQQTICDMNGEPYRAEEYGFTMARVTESFVDISDFLAPAECWGDVGAASGILFVNLVVSAALRGYSRGPYTLVCASSEGGDRGAALIHTANPRRRS